MEAAFIGQIGARIKARVKGWVNVVKDLIGPIADSGLEPGGSQVTVTIDASVLTAYYQARSGLLGATVSTATSSGSGTPKTNPTPPWGTGSTAPQISALTKNFLAGGQLMDATAAKLDVPGASADYKRVLAAALADYKRVLAAALADYKRVEAPALAEYERVVAAALADCERVEAPAWADYKRVEAAEHAKCCPDCPWDGHTIFRR